MQHHLLTKNATDKVLHSLKHSVWSNELISASVYQTVAGASFPAPDAMLYDPEKHRSIAMEFKPPTESKRGILTGLGQSIAYLSDASLSYLIAPSVIEGYDIGSYLTKLFAETLQGQVPVGLILYTDNEAKELALSVDIDTSLQLKRAHAQGMVGRYWAKHIDMPQHLLWEILNIAYLMPDSSQGLDKIWKECWDKFLFPKSHERTLDVIPTKITKHDGTPLYILDRTKNKLRLQVSSGQLTEKEALEQIREKVQTGFPGDNYYNSYRKNFFPFIKHLGLWDDKGRLTEDGLKLHHIGKLHGPTGTTFREHFGSVVLRNGRHLDLILDIEDLTRNKPFSNSSSAVEYIRDDYVDKGLFRQNPGKKTTGSAPFLKYERILWGHLHLLDKVGTSQYVRNKGFAFNWRYITKLSSL